MNAKPVIQVPTSGPELVALMKKGARVQRGVDWKWADQDGPKPGIGRVISDVGEDGWIRVQWDTGTTNSYRMGKEKKYDLKLSESFIDNESESETEFSTPCDDSTHLNKSSAIQIVASSASKYLESAICLSTALHISLEEKASVKNLCHLLKKRAIEDDNYSNWVGIVQSMTSSPAVCFSLSDPTWLNLLLDLSKNSRNSITKRVLALRVLSSILLSWRKSNERRMKEIIDELLSTIGCSILECENDPTLMVHDGSRTRRKKRAYSCLTASYTSTISEEGIKLIRNLLSSEAWSEEVLKTLVQYLEALPLLINPSEDENVSSTSIFKFKKFISC